MICSVENKVDLRGSEKLAELNLKVKQIRWEEKLKNKVFLKKKKDFFEPITKTVDKRSKYLLEEAKTTIAANE